MPLWTTADIPDQTGRLAVVTGANSGLGFEIARALAEAGAHVVLACRNEAKASDAAKSIRDRHPRSSVEVRTLDLADLASVAAFTDQLLSERRPVDLLVNNAGLMAIDASRTVDGYETQFQVNHLGHFALTGRLLPLMTGRPGSRVATMSSVGHRLGRLAAHDLMFDRRPYRRWGAYMQSKLANILFTRELQRRLVATGAATIAVAAHPGGSRTDLGFEGTALVNRVMPAVIPLFTQSAAAGALPMLRAATDPGVQGGEYFGPRLFVWGSPVRETPSRRARNDRDAEVLWDLSAELTGVAPLTAAS
ncbi:oxidoreductase [Nocardia aobensis]|uniref:Oxidoreductase n=1 Tax=Nocardia aobensis TaxID=257277 RepID=A0ABW6PA15_9NOCA